MNSEDQVNGKAAGTISALFRFTEKGKPGKPVEEAYFRKDLGMEGDRHATGGEKQLTLLAGETRKWMKEQETPGLCFKRYKANLETADLDVGVLEPGMRLKAGTAVFTVTECAKECFPECILLQSGISCRLSSGGIYLKVTESGTANIGSTIFIF